MQYSTVGLSMKIESSSSKAWPLPPGLRLEVEDDVGDALPFETDDRPAEDAHQAAVVGEKLRYGDVAAACIGVGADVGVGLLGLAQAEERVAVGESLGLDREGLAAALQVDAEALPEELEVVAEEQGRGLHVAVVVDVAEVFGGRYAVDGRDAVAAPEGGVERAVDQQRVVDLQYVECRHADPSVRPLPVARGGVDRAVEHAHRHDAVVGILVVQAVEVGAHDPEEVGREQRILAQRVAAGVDLGHDGGPLGGREQRVEPRVAGDAVEVAVEAHARAGRR